MKSVATQAFWLRPREKQLLRRFAQGKSDKEIGREIGGTEKQVGGQRQALIKKLCIQFDGQLATAADELAPWPKRREDGGHKPPP